MKALLTLSTIFIALSLSACGNKHQTYAVDALEQAQANAIANAPKAEPIKFDDENAAKAGTAATDAAAPADATTATAEATAPATADTTATAEAAKTEQSATATATAETKTSQ